MQIQFQGINLLVLVYSLVYYCYSVLYKIFILKRLYRRILLIRHSMVWNGRWTGTAMENKYVFTLAEAPEYIEINHDQRFIPICDTTKGVESW